MADNKGRTIVVTGATGLQGGAVTRRLLADGWRVRALTRDAGSAKAQTLAGLGAEVVQGDMTEPASLIPVMTGAYGVFSVQNPMICGMNGEICQGKFVATVAQQVGIQHLVYGSAGTGARGTGIPSWESKLIVEAYMQSLGLPLTILRPTAFMELMTAKQFFPAVSTWHLMPRMMGGATQIPWLSARDYGLIVARVFAEPGQFVGGDVRLASDIRSIDECRAIYREVTGRNPRRFPMPVWLFARFGFVGKDLTAMWRWLRDTTLDVEIGPTLAMAPDALNVQSWLEQQKR